MMFDFLKKKKILENNDIELNICALLIHDAKIDENCRKFTSK